MPHSLQRPAPASSGLTRLAALLEECLPLWGAPAAITALPDSVEVVAVSGDARLEIFIGDGPPMARWLVVETGREGAMVSRRACPSLLALLGRVRRFVESGGRRVAGSLP